MHLCSGCGTEPFDLLGWYPKLDAEMIALRSAERRCEVDPGDASTLRRTFNDDGN